MKDVWGHMHFPASPTGGVPGGVPGGGSRGVSWGDWPGRKYGEPAPPQQIHARSQGAGALSDSTLQGDKVPFRNLTRRASLRRAPGSADFDRISWCLATEASRSYVLTWHRVCTLKRVYEVQRADI